ncbi:hypothetical protein DXG01_005921 [Tephrocybe rancida]|nr:hypothetical protein DXG01_005921 [Tephrocybe rancida]
MAVGPSLTGASLVYRSDSIISCFLIGLQCTALEFEEALTALTTVMITLVNTRPEKESLKSKMYQDQVPPCTEDLFCADFLWPEAPLNILDGFDIRPPSAAQLKQRRLKAARTAKPISSGIRITPTSKKAKTLHSCPAYEQTAKDSPAIQDSKHSTDGYDPPGYWDWVTSSQGTSSALPTECTFSKHEQDNVDDSGSDISGFGPPSSENSDENRYQYQFSQTITGEPSSVLTSGNRSDSANSIADSLFRVDAPLDRLEISPTTMAEQEYCFVPDDKHDDYAQAQGLLINDPNDQTTLASQGNFAYFFGDVVEGEGFAREGPDNNLANYVDPLFNFGDIDNFKPGGVAMDLLPRCLVQDVPPPSPSMIHSSPGSTTAACFPRSPRPRSASLVRMTSATSDATISPIDCPSLHTNPPIESPSGGTASLSLDSTSTVTDTEKEHGERIEAVHIGLKREWLMQIVLHTPFPVKGVHIKKVDELISSKLTPIPSSGK